ncbi:MAG TPA: M14 family metallopeptidase [Vicinamibacterales bacterium]|nr:M14 family metallopeptidase [Vicinamibacterales bacterium]
MRGATGLAVLMTVLAIAPRAAAQAPFVVRDITAAPGAAASGTLQVPAAGADKGTTIPITIINGTRPGPVLALVAGTHGMEYPPILAVQRLRTAIAPGDLRGTIVMVHVANMPSFLGRTIYYSPVDGQNLNRVFPGKAGGTLSERIAHVITTEVIERATHVVDIHCGDGNEWLRPYTYWVTTGDPKVAAAGREMALAFGLEMIVEDTSRPGEPSASVYLSNTAITRGKPALTVESGAWARTDEESIARIERGVHGLLRHLGMRQTGPAPVQKPIWIGRNEVLRSSVTGILYPLVEPDRDVPAGALVARVTDFHGRTLEEIKAPFAGRILYVVATPPINAGEPVGFVGEVKQ